MINLKTDNNGFVLDNSNNLTIVEGDAQIKDMIVKRLRTYKNGFFLDRQRGTDWIGTIFKAPYNPVLAESEIKRVILSTPGVKSLLSITLKLDHVNRILEMYNIRYTTENGISELNS